MIRFLFSKLMESASFTIERGCCGAISSMLQVKSARLQGAPLARCPQMDDAGTPLQTFGAQLRVRLAPAIDLAAVLVLAVGDHLLPALGRSAVGGLLFTLSVREHEDRVRRDRACRRGFGFLRARRPEDGAEQQNAERCVEFHDLSSDWIAISMPPLSGQRVTVRFAGRYGRSTGDRPGLSAEDEVRRSKHAQRGPEIVE